MVFSRLRRRFARLFFGTGTVSIPQELDLVVDTPIRSFLCPVQYAKKYGPKPTKALESKKANLSEKEVEAPNGCPEQDSSEKTRVHYENTNRNTNVLKRAHTMPLCSLPRNDQGYWYFATDEQLPSYNLYEQLFGNPTARPWGVKVFPNIPSPRNSKYPKCIFYTPADMTADEEVTTVYIATLGKLPTPGTFGLPSNHV